MRRTSTAEPAWTRASRLQSRIILRGATVRQQQWPVLVARKDVAHVKLGGRRVAEGGEAQGGTRKRVAAALGPTVRGLCKAIAGLKRRGRESNRLKPN